MTAIPLTPPPGTVPPPDLSAAQVDLPMADAMPVPTAASPSLTSASVREDASVQVMLIEELDQVASHINELLHEHQHIQLVETVADGNAAIDHIVASSPDIVVIDALMQGKTGGLGVARRMRGMGMTTPIIFMTVPDHPVTLTPEMGIAEVVTLPLDGDTLLRSIVQLDGTHRGSAPLPLSGTVAVFSGKGGVGRTTIAHNLAVSLSKRPKTSVVLIDGDLVHGDLRLHLAAPETAPSLLQLPTGFVSEVDVAPLLWEDGAGVHVLLAPPRMEQADLILQRDVEKALNLLRRMYDVVIIDVPAAMDDRALSMLDTADVLLDVVTSERGAVRKAQRCRTVLTAAGYPMEKVVTVVNRSDDPGLAADVLVAELGHEPHATLPSESRLATGELEEGHAIVAAHPDAPISHGFAGLAQVLIDRVQGVPAVRAA